MHGLRVKRGRQAAGLHERARRSREGGGGSTVASRLRDVRYRRDQRAAAAAAAAAARLREGIILRRSAPARPGWGWRSLSPRLFEVGPPPPVSADPPLPL